MGLHVKAGTITTGLFALLLIGSVTLAAVTLARTFETANDVDRLRRDLATVERTLEDVGSAAAGACVGSRWNRDALVAVLGAVGVPPDVAAYERAGLAEKPLFNCR